ncbi:MAG: tyrosine-type recombinase/integrase [Candidatus Sigynarchaeota archaeon]
MITKSKAINIVNEIGIPEPDASIFADYLVKLENQSDESFTEGRRIIGEFYQATGLKPITEITLEDIEIYFDFLRSKKIRDSTRYNYSMWIKTWYNVIKKILFLRGITIPNFFDYIENPFAPSRKNKSAFLKIDLTMDARAETKALTDDQVSKILREAKIRSRPLYILLLILKYTGMRISEAITIRIENINLKERVIASGVVKNHRKTGTVYFFVPQHVAHELRSYMMELNQECEWLFPSRFQNYQYHYSKAQAEYWLRQMWPIVGFRFTSHQFRHTIIFKRLKNHCPPHINEILQNHAIPGTQAKFYRERNLTLRDRRDLYDKWNPWDSSMF